MLVFMRSVESCMMMIDESNRVVVAGESDRDCRFF